MALARAIALDPELMMYRAIYWSGPYNIICFVALIKVLNDALNMTSVVVTHDVQEIFSIADHVIIVSGGKVIAEGWFQI